MAQFLVPPCSLQSTLCNAANILYQLAESAAKRKYLQTFIAVMSRKYDTSPRCFNKTASLSHCKNNSYKCNKIVTLYRESPITLHTHTHTLATIGSYFLWFLTERTELHSVRVKSSGIYRDSTPGNQLHPQHIHNTCILRHNNYLQQIYIL